MNYYKQNIVKDYAVHVAQGEELLAENVVPHAARSERHLQSRDAVDDVGAHLASVVEHLAVRNRVLQVAL
jgi:hypothetical protein